MKNGFYHIFAMIATSLILSVSPSHAFNWCKAPLACLPDRSVKWETNTNPEPCHCPPESYCVALNLEPADIDFIISPTSDYSITDALHGHVQPTFPTITINGSEVPSFANKSITLKDILNMQDGGIAPGNTSVKHPLAELFKQPYLNKTKNVPDPGPLYDVNHPPLTYGIDLTHTYGLFKINVTIQMDNPTKLTNWINDQKMPLALASRCCDSICPEGLTPEIGKSQVTKTKEHITFTQQEITTVKKAFVDIVDIIYSQIPKAPCPNSCQNNNGGNNNEENNGEGNNTPENNNSEINPNLPPILLSETYDTNQAFYNALKAALDQLSPALDSFYANPSNTQAVLTLNAYIKQFMTVYETSITEIKAMTKVQYTVAMEFYTKTKTEETVIQKPTEIVTVDSLQCKAHKEAYREGCILAGTPITLADGTTKPIEELNIGDKVLGNNGSAKIKAKSRFSQEVDYMYSINGEKAFFTVEHPILTPQGWKSIDPNITSTKKGNTVIIGPLQVGDTLLLKGGKTVTVKSIEKVEVKNNPDAYNLSIEGDGSFIANDFIMKGFKQMQMHY